MQEQQPIRIRPQDVARDLYDLLISTDTGILFYRGDGEPGLSDCPIQGIAEPRVWGPGETADFTVSAGGRQFIIRIIDKGTA